MTVVRFITPRDKWLEQLRRSLPRLLRTYERVAREYHDCYVCKDLIWPGQMYIGRVYITPFRNGKRIVVSKEHFDDCGPSPEEDEERLREMRDFEEHMDDLEKDSVIEDPAAAA